MKGCIKYLNLSVVILVTISFILWACSGGGGGNSSGNGDNNGENGSTIPITFSGGTLEELKISSPTLTFNALEITGKLTLPHYSNETIKVNELTITSSGSIGYSYSTCEYIDAPSINIEASGEVIIEGNINLNGRSGTRVTSGAICNSCYGQDGGHVEISAESIIVTGNINKSGGSGGSSVYVGFPSSGCSGGASGNTILDASDIDLSGGSLSTRAGQGGYGGSGSGSNGASGTVDLLANDDFKMINGEVFSSGELTLQAAKTEIYGPITCGRLIESIGGAIDDSPPDVLIKSPSNNSNFTWGDSIDVIIQAIDAGTGIKSVSIVGLGYDETHSGNEFQDGLLTITIPFLDMPATLSITVEDNKGNFTDKSLSGLSLSYTQENEPNNSPSGSQNVDCPDIIEGDVSEGDMGTIKTLSYPGSGSPDLDQTLQDWYSFTVDSLTGVSIELDFTGSAVDTDIDLFLFDVSGSMQLDQSFKDNKALNDYTEKIFEVLDVGTYIVGIQAYNCDLREDYRLTLTK